MISSCVSLRNNYLGKAERDVVVQFHDTKKLAVIESLRQFYNNKTDSLLLIINHKKPQNKHLTASEINQLYSNFGEQLDNDRVFNGILHRKNRHNDHLSKIERYAGARLLLSAKQYHFSYGKNYNVRRNLNRGDLANNIPPNLLNASRNYLYSTSIRKALAKKKYEMNDATDSILQLLPRTNIFKASIYRLNLRTDILYTSSRWILHTVGNKLLNKTPDPLFHRAYQRKYAQQLLSVIKPYDILLMRSPNFLSNELIPGYLGHASIWLGAEVKKRNRHKIFYHTKMTIHTRGMAEAIKSGVKMSTLRNFAEGETYFILRLKDITDDEKKLVLKHTSSQMGKNYDFNFDLESSDEINCTELIYLAYDFINWKVNSFLGRYTIFPDDILSTAQDNNRFEIVAILKNGVLIPHPDIVAIKACMND